MNRYLLKFNKTGQLRYTSHLDLVRLFKRNFKRAGIDLVYSRGFKPKPKISFAQPLSLGYESKGEYVEIETQRAYNPEMIMGLVNSHMPFGIEITECKVLDSKTNKIPAIVEYADYVAVLDSKIKFSKHNIIEEFLKQDKILIEKWAKKKKKEITTDIKPLIENITLDIKGQNLNVFMSVKTGSRANLNPESLLEALFKYDNLVVSKGDYRISRLDLFDISKNPLI